MNKSQEQIYLVDDDADLREAMMETFEMEGISAQAFANAPDLLNELDPEWEGVVLSDIRMPGMDGFELLKEINRLCPDIPVVMITGHGDIASAIASMKEGAFDYIEKPADPRYLISVLHRALKLRQLQIENQRLKSRMARGGDIRARLLGRSKVMRACRSQIINVAPLNVDVLLVGESGTGKELTARCLHDHSTAKGDFAGAGCSELNVENFDQKMFSDRPSHFGAALQAHKGTLFLDRIDKLNPNLQNRMLQLIKAQKLPRIIASTCENPADLVASGRLRSDLYYHLNVAEIHLPSLRERGNDIFFLLEYFIRDAASRYRRKLPLVTAEQLRPFKTHPWPGNVRELRNMAERLVIGLNVNFAPQTPEEQLTKSYDMAMQVYERELLQAALLQSEGRRGAAAARLMIPRKRLYLRMRALGLLEPDQ